MLTGDKIKQAAWIIQEADALLLCSGAGMGVDSGLPDFRGDKGFWKAYPPFEQPGISFIEMADPSWFFRDPELAWGFYGHRLNLYRRITPHDGFRILLEWGKNLHNNYFVFTSNVDGHFQKAGFDSNKIEEVHGSVNFVQCSSPCSEKIWTAEGTCVYVNEKKMKAVPPLPLCPDCGKVARPNVLMFSDWKWNNGRSEKQNRNFIKWLNTNQACKIVIIECGAGTGVPTVRNLSEEIVRKLDAKLVRINIRESEVPEGHLSLSLSAREALLKINSAIK